MSLLTPVFRHLFKKKKGVERDLRNWTLGQYWTFSWKPFIFSPSSVQQRAYRCCHLCVACKKKHGVTGYGSQFSTLFLHMPACLIICWPIIIINQKVSRLNFLISMDFIIFVCLGDLCTSHRCCRRCRKCDVSYKKTIKIFYSVLVSNDIFIVVLIELLVVKLKFCSLNPSEKYLITIRVQYHLCQNFEPRHKTIITFAVAPCSTGKPSVGPPCWEHLTGCQMTCDPRVLPPAEWCLSTLVISLQSILFSISHRERRSRAQRVTASCCRKTDLLSPMWSLLELIKAHGYGFWL